MEELRLGPSSVTGDPPDGQTLLHMNHEQPAIPPCASICIGCSCRPALRHGGLRHELDAEPDRSADDSHTSDDRYAANNCCADGGGLRGRRGTQVVT